MAQESSGKTLRLDDIYYVLFRRKWWIVGFFMAGLIAAAAIWKALEPKYTSEAQLLVRYIIERGAVLPPSEDGRLREVDVIGDVFSTEIQILSSADLARQVAEAVGPERILGGRVDDEDLLEKATSTILKGLSRRVQANVIHVTYAHSDPEICQPVLRQLIDDYLKLHAEIHLQGVKYDLIAKEVQERRSSLQEIEERLQQLRQHTGGVSLDAAKLTVASEIEDLRGAILEAESDLASKEVLMGSRRSYDPAETNAPGRGARTGAVQGDESVSGLLAYQASKDQLRELRAREQDYLSRFTEENPLVKSVRKQILQLESRIRGMLSDNPQLAMNDMATVGTSDSAQVMAPVESVASLNARINVLRSQLEKARKESLLLSDLEKQVSDIELSKEIQKDALKYLATSLDQARYDTALESGKNSNINLLQEPSKPRLDSQRVQKIAGLAFVVLAGAGLMLAFLFELFLDPRVKRSIQLEQKTRLPVYVTIPECHADRNGRKRLVQHAEQSGLVGSPEGQDSVAVVPASQDNLRPYYEALRDRLIIYFERVNLRRKPKLVGVSSCHGEAGVSSVAEGLASTLSETGGGKVLLVDLNQGQESVHTFHRGRSAVELPELLQQGTVSGQGESGDTLFLASLGKAKGDYHPIRSREFDALIPQLKASDFDYIVFDMPPMTTTSVTFRMAGFLDKMLLVAESERTHMESLKRVVSRLQESSSRTALVMNRARDYMPRWMQPPE